MLLNGSDGDHEPTFVHRHLLNGRTLRYGKTFRTALADETTRGFWDDIRILVIRIDLYSLRAIEMWSRWLYGQPMWSEDDCDDVDYDLSCLMEIWHLCAGQEDGKGRDHEGLNASTDAIRDLVLNDIHVPKCLNCVLEDFDEFGLYYKSSDIMIKMLAELLVYGNCASDGRTKKWLEADEGAYPCFLAAISTEFAKKAMGEASPDLMARGAYHTHQLGSENDPSPRGRAWKSTLPIRRAFKNISLTDQIPQKNLSTQRHFVRLW